MLRRPKLSKNEVVALKEKEEEEISTDEYKLRSSLISRSSRATVR
jgi:hypothetical protein